MATTTPRIALVGAGLVGSLLAILLARRGLKIEIFERRPDMRRESISAGRSINLAISTRGINALARLGIAEQILAYAVPMRGRMMHSPGGELTFQPYGMDDRDCINSISRATLNKVLMTRAEETGLVELSFNRRIVAMEFDSGTLHIQDELTGEVTTKQYDIVIGTDGSASAVRQAMVESRGYSSCESYLDYGYKELVIPSLAGGGFKMEPNALHIWPRGNFMLIALGNFEGSFTCTLFLPQTGPVSFEHLRDDEAIAEFFNRFFPDAVPLIEDLVGTFQSNPTGHLVTIKTSPWSVGGRGLLVGDAAHAIVPFFGQGMNCGFEDCTVLADLLDGYDDITSVDWEALFDRFFALRKVNTDAIADMAVENFVEMRDKVADKQFLLERAVEKVLQREFPGRYVSRYSLVTFSNVPYKVALDAGAVEDEILAELCGELVEPEAVDLVRAEQLIVNRLSPVLEPYRHLLGRFESGGKQKESCLKSGGS